MDFSSLMLICCDDVKKLCMEYPDFDDPELLSLINDYFITTKEVTGLCDFFYNDAKTLLRKTERCGDNILDIIFKLEKIQNDIDHQLEHVGNRLGALIGRKSRKVLKMKKNVIITMETCMRGVFYDVLIILDLVRKLRSIETESVVGMENNRTMLKSMMLDLVKHTRKCEKFAQFGLCVAREKIIEFMSLHQIYS